MQRAPRLVSATGLAAAAIAVLTQCSSPGVTEGTARPADGATAGSSSAESSDVRIDRAAVEPWLGEWTGPVTQAGAPPYTVNMTLEHDGESVVGTVEYPDLDCSGTLGDATLDDEVLTIVETITVGDEVCLTPLDLTLTLKPGEVIYRFDIQGGGDGVLHRPVTLRG